MDTIQTSVAFIEKICSHSPLLVSLYSRPYRKVLLKEIELANITHRDIVLNIGCGSIPFSAIYIHRLTKAKVLAMDYDEEAIKNARICLKRFDLLENIQLHLGDGSRDIPCCFTVALVALQARPKEEIFKQLQEKGLPSARVIIRKPKKNLNRYYDSLSTLYSPEKIVAQSMKTFDESQLFIIKGRDRS